MCFPSFPLKKNTRTSLLRLVLAVPEVAEIAGASHLATNGSDDMIQFYYISIAIIYVYIYIGTQRERERYIYIYNVLHCENKDALPAAPGEESCAAVAGLIQGIWIVIPLVSIHVWVRSSYRIICKDLFWGTCWEQHNSGPWVSMGSIETKRTARNGRRLASRRI